MQIYTCHGVASLVRKVSHSIQKFITSGMSIQVPLCPWVTAVLRQTCHTEEAWLPLRYTYNAAIIIVIIILGASHHQPSTANTRRYDISFGCFDFTSTISSCTREFVARSYISRTRKDKLTRLAQINQHTYQSEPFLDWYQRHQPCEQWKLGWFWSSDDQYSRSHRPAALCLPWPGCCRQLLWRPATCYQIRATFT